MAKYIDADKLEAEIDGENRPEINSGSEEAKWIRECIRKAPSADVRPERHGHWIEEDIQICSECGEEHSWEDHRASYCDCCGAKMDGEDDEQ